MSGDPQRAAVYAWEQRLYGLAELAPLRRVLSIDQTKAIVDVIWPALIGTAAPAPAIVRTEEEEQIVVVRSGKRYRVGAHRYARDVHEIQISRSRWVLQSAYHEIAHALVCSFQALGAVGPVASSHGPVWLGVYLDLLESHCDRAVLTRELGKGSLVRVENPPWRRRSS